jgi:hypothetical protein
MSWVSLTLRTYVGRGAALGPIFLFSIDPLGLEDRTPQNASSETLSVRSNRGRPCRLNLRGLQTR